MPRPVRIGISACLLGEEVRHDGGHKRDAFLTETFGAHVDWVPVCPEVDIGLGIPRPPIRLESRGGEVRLIMPSSGQDLTEGMREYAERRVRWLSDQELSGYVLKAGSPSCGMERVELHGPRGAPAEEGRGLFARILMERLPHLPVEEEGGLGDPRRRENFIRRVFAYHRWQEVERRGVSRGRLRRFHERHRLLMVARDQRAARRLGRLLEAGERRSAGELARSYLDGFTAIMRRPPTRRGHTGVLKHLAGHVGAGLDGDEGRELSGLIEDYRRGRVPLVVPLTLIRRHVRELGVDDLADQAYLEPHPHELMLLNHA